MCWPGEEAGGDVGLAGDTSQYLLVSERTEEL